jgi:LPS-assembly lipoprotein
MNTAMRYLLVVLTLLVSACGFQLRGGYALPFDSIYIDLPTSSPLYADLKRNIEATSKTRVITKQSEAQATLSVIADRPSRNIMSLSGEGRVREFQLTRQFVYRVYAPNGKDFIPQSEILIRRDMSYSDEKVLAKESEEVLLQRDMQTDLVAQLMRRLSAVKLSDAAAP